MRVGNHCKVDIWCRLHLMLYLRLLVQKTLMPNKLYFSRRDGAVLIDAHPETTPN